MTVLLSILAILAVIGLGLEAVNAHRLTREAEEKLAESLSDLTQRFAVLESAVWGAREDIQRLSGHLPATRGALEGLRDVIDAALKELAEQEKKRNEPPIDGWKAGEVALGRIERHRREMQRLEDESLSEYLRGVGSDT